MDRFTGVGKASRSRQEASINTTDTSIGLLITIFCFWKLLLMLVAVASPGPGYDTSTEILLRRHSDTAESWSEHLVSRLTRWDGLYFASAAERGPVFEQQWVFSPFLAKITSSLMGVFSWQEHRFGITGYAFAGIAISHISHLIAILLVFRLTYEILPGCHDSKRQIAFTTACLHILSPAGLFLSAPYGESAFAMTNFAGLLCYVKARQAAQEQRNEQVAKAALWTVTSGTVFGFATMIRSNGLLNTLIFAWDAIGCLPDLIEIFKRRGWPELLQLTSTLVAGGFIAIGYALPQLVAYLEYCTAGIGRPWCNNLMPSIYSFVQSHYWNVGLMRYWTTSNIPLFALATPMLSILMSTAYAALNSRQLDRSMDVITFTGRNDQAGEAQRRNLFSHTIRRMAVPQMILAVLALTSFHVQIVNRLSSGYPVWYILLAIGMHSKPAAGKVEGSVIAFLEKYAEWLVRSSVIYAIVQGGLYASFMPPA